MRKILIVVCLLLFSFASIAFASSKKEIKTEEAEITSEMLDIPRARDLAIDPFGRESVNYTEVTLTDEEIEKLEEKAKSGKPFTAVIAMHMMQSQFNSLQALGAKETLEKYGFEILSINEANWQPEVHIQNLQTSIEMKPDLIISIPVAEKAEVEIHKQIGENGIKLVTIDLHPFGLQYPDEIQGFVTTTERGNGYTCGEHMGELLGGKGKVAIMELSFYHYCTNERVIGFQEALAEKYPDIEIVDTVGFTSREEARRVADALIAKYQDLDGIFPVWDVPGLEVAQAAKDAGRTPNDFVITTTDLNESGALEVVKDGFIKQLSASDPYIMGRTAALLGIKAVLGDPGPPFVSVQGFAFTKENVVEGYRVLNRQKPSPEMLELAEQWQ
jgi:ribose transport system substrate-binding protein